MTPLLLFIRTLHVAVMACVILGPFVIQSSLLMLIYIITVSCIMLHWIFNDDTCVLTIIESKLRGISKVDTFSSRMVSPVYKITSKEIWLITSLLMLIMILRLRRQLKFYQITESMQSFVDNKYPFIPSYIRSSKVFQICIL